MGESTSKAPPPEWYEQGLRFQCTQCGNCCTGPPGAVWFDDHEADSMAAAIGVSTAEFRRTWARRLHGRWSLKEHLTEYGWDCVFLDRSFSQGAPRAGCTTLVRDSAERGPFGRKIWCRQRLGQQPVGKHPVPVWTRAALFLSSRFVFSEIPPKLIWI